MRIVIYYRMNTISGYTLMLSFWISLFCCCVLVKCAPFSAFHQGPLIKCVITWCFDCALDSNRFPCDCFFFGKGERSYLVVHFFKPTLEPHADRQRIHSTNISDKASNQNSCFSQKISQMLLSLWRCHQKCHISEKNQRNINIWRVERSFSWFRYFATVLLHFFWKHIPYHRLSKSRNPFTSPPPQTKPTSMPEHEDNLLIKFESNFFRLMENFRAWKVSDEKIWKTREQESLQSPGDFTEWNIW